MSDRESSRLLRFVWAAGLVALAVGLAGGLAGQAPSSRQAVSMSSKFPNAVNQAVICTDCARLSAHVFHLPGYGCLDCGDMLKDLFGAAGFFDPDIWIKNHGNLPSQPGTLKVQWYDLAKKANITRTVAVPAVAAGAEEYVTIPDPGMLFLAAEGVTLTLDYADAHGSRHKTRKVTKCPDL